MNNTKTVVMAVLAVAIAAQVAGASVVTLTGGCPLYIINSSRSYITFNITNTGNGTASDLLISANFPGVDSRNATQVIPTVEPGHNYSKQFFLSHLIGQGSYAVNINATYVQSGSTYATVFPCIIYIGSLAGGPLLESVTISGNRLYVNVTNTAPQSIKAQVTAIVPASFTVKNTSTRAITVGPDGKAGIYFDIEAPSYTDASFPLIGELSYEYNSRHYAQMASGVMAFGSGGGVGSGNGGLGAAFWALAIIIVIVLILIAASLLMRLGGKKGGGAEARMHEHAHQHSHTDPERGAQHTRATQAGTLDDEGQPL